jgi:hypothetical protein
MNAYGCVNLWVRYRARQSGIEMSWLTCKEYTGSVEEVILEKCDNSATNKTIDVTVL